MGQTSLHVEYEHDLFIIQVSCINPNITQTRLASAHDPFIIELVMSGLSIMSNFATFNS